MFVFVLRLCILHVHRYCMCMDMCIEMPMHKSLETPHPSSRSTNAFIYSCGIRSYGPQNYIGHTYIGLNYIDLNYIGHSGIAEQQHKHWKCGSDRGHARDSGNSRD